VLAGGQVQLASIGCTLADDVVYDDPPAQPSLTSSSPPAA
jgi:hypothetical protein